jgi:hypothetical protein
MEVSSSLQALPFELNPDQYSALVEEFHNCAADFLKDLPYAKVTATKEEIGSFLNDADARKDLLPLGLPKVFRNGIHPIPNHGSLSLSVAGLVQNMRLCRIFCICGSSVTSKLV